MNAIDDVKVLEEQGEQVETLESIELSLPELDMVGGGSIIVAY